MSDFNEIDYRTLDFSGVDFELDENGEVMDITDEVLDYYTVPYEEIMDYLK